MTENNAPEIAIACKNLRRISLRSGILLQQVKVPSTLELLKTIAVLSTIKRYTTLGACLCDL